jgi:hypothetical protein
MCPPGKPSAPLTRQPASLGVINNVDHHYMIIKKGHHVWCPPWWRCHRSRRALECGTINWSEKKSNLVHKVAPNVRFGHELANREFRVTKLPQVSILVTQ